MKKTLVVSQKLLLVVALLVILFCAPVSAELTKSVNVAEGKKVIVSSFHTFNTDYRGEYLTDSNKSTAWSAGSSESQYAIIDLQGQYAIDYFRVKFRANAGASDNEKKEFMILASNSLDFSDSKLFVTVEEVPPTLETELGDDPGHVQWCSFDSLDKTNAYRYVKILKKDGKTGLGFRDFQVFSKTEPAVTFSPKAVYGVRIGGDMIKTGESASIKYKTDGELNKDADKFVVQWLCPDETLAVNDITNTTKKWKLIPDLTGWTITVPSNFESQWIKAVVYPVDSDGTIGAYTMTEPRRIMPSHAYTENVFDTYKPTVTAAVTHNEHPAGNAIDSKYNTFWTTSSTGPHYLTVEFEEPVKPEYIHMAPRNGSENEWKEFKLVASNDNFATEVLLYTQTGQYTEGSINSTNNVEHAWEKELFLTQPYRYYKLIKTTNLVFGIAELKFLFYKASPQPIIEGNVEEGNPLTAKVTITQNAEVKQNMLLILAHYSNGNVLKGVTYQPFPVPSGHGFITKKCEYTPTNLSDGDYFKSFIWEESPMIPPYSNPSEPIFYENTVLII